MRQGREISMRETYGRKAGRDKRRRNRRSRKKSCAGRFWALLGIILGIAAVWILLRTGRGLVSETLLQREGFPESLISLMERNPQTREFVLDYPNRASYSQVYPDLSGEVTKGTIPLFLQWDKRWGYETYGNDFLAVTGCGPTCLSMVYCGLTGDTGWNPYQMAVMAEEGGYYVDGVGTAWSLMDEGASSLGLSVCGLTIEEQSVKDALAAGRPVICSVGPGDFTAEGHFIVLTGMDRDGRIRVADPNSITNSRKSWDAEILLPQIRGMWSYAVSG